jgi:hypothetical protein
MHDAGLGHQRRKALVTASGDQDGADVDNLHCGKGRSSGRRLNSSMCSRTAWNICSEIVNRRQSPFLGFGLVSQPALPERDTWP